MGKRNEWWERSMNIHMREDESESSKPQAGSTQPVSDYVRKFREDVQKIRQRIGTPNILEIRTSAGEHMKKFQTDIEALRKKFRGG